MALKVIEKSEDGEHKEIASSGARLVGCDGRSDFTNGRSFSLRGEDDDRHYSDGSSSMASGSLVLSFFARLSSTLRLPMMGYRHLCGLLRRRLSCHALAPVHFILAIELKFMFDVTLTHADARPSSSRLFDFFLCSGHRHR